MDFQSQLIWSLICVHGLVGLIVLILCWLMTDDDELIESIDEEPLIPRS